MMVGRPTKLRMTQEPAHLEQTLESELVQSELKKQQVNETTAFITRGPECGLLVSSKSIPFL